MAVLFAIVQNNDYITNALKRKENLLIMFTYKDEYKTFQAVKLEDTASILDLDNRVLRCVSVEGVAEKHGCPFDRVDLSIYSERDQKTIEKHI